MSTAHTPGPWFFRKEVTRGQFVTDCVIRDENSTNGSYLAKVGPCNSEANAQLIAAAPDLLNALQIAEATIQRIAPDGERATQGTRDVITSALAKVTP